MHLIRITYCNKEYNLFKKVKKRGGGVFYIQVKRKQLQEISYSNKWQDELTRTHKEGLY